MCVAGVLPCYTAIAWSMLGRYVALMTRYRVEVSRSHEPGALLFVEADNAREAAEEIRRSLSDCKIRVRRSDRLQKAGNGGGAGHASAR